MKEETPYEKKQREFAKERNQPYVPQEEQKVLTPEEIESAKAEIEKDFRLKYAKAVSHEITTISKSVDTLF